MTLYKGVGDCAIRTKSLPGGAPAQIVFGYPVYDFEFAQESDTSEPEVYRGGRRVTEEAFESKLTSTLKLSTQITNWHMLGLSFGQLPKTFTSFSFPKVSRGVVGAGGTITDAGIITGNLSSVLVAIESYGSWGQARSLTRASGAPAAGEVQVAAGTLTFNAAQIGAPVTWIYDVTIASAKGYGGPGASSAVGGLEFSGQIFDNTAQESDGGRIWFPSITISTKPTLSFTGDIATLETEFSAAIPAGWSDCYWLLDGHSMT